VAVIPAHALEVEHLTLRAGGKEIVADLSFSVTAGTTLAVIGPNGAGKTLLFRALVGAIPHDGRILWSPGTRFGYVPQKLDLERDVPISGRDLLVARARLTGAASADLERTAGLVELAREALDSGIGTLSGGQFQRLLLAFALLGDPTVLLLDEPNAGVDEAGQKRVNETLERLQRETGLTLLLISHDLAVVSRCATHVLCLNRGQWCFGTPQKVLTAGVLSEFYGAPVGLHPHDQPLG
jgi:zinc transport system ATP-binding protein